MKKRIILSLAGVLAAAAFAPEASAVPAFARQTGMACSACHFQHFPLLNGFGRSFKASGFTIMGTQAKLEGEHLELPATLNISGLATAGMDIINNSKTHPEGSDAHWFVPNLGGELSLFFGGRISENVGFLSELAFPDGTQTCTIPAGGGTCTTNAMNSNAKMPVLFDVAGNKVGLVFTNGGPSYAMELLNTGANSAHRLMGNKGTTNAVSGGSGNHINATSAAQYLGVKSAPGAGFSVVATGGWGFVNAGKYTSGVTGADTNAFNSTYLRGAATFDAAGWDTAVGVQSISGTDGFTTGGVPAPETKLTVFDAQAQGEAAGMPVGVYFSMGTAPKASGAAASYFNAGGATDRKSTNIAVEVGIIPHVSTLQLAIRRGKNGAATDNADNALMLGATYELAQNVELSVTRTANSGSAYNATPNVTGKTQTTLLLEALF